MAANLAFGFHRGNPLHEAAPEIAGQLEEKFGVLKKPERATGSRRSFTAEDMEIGLWSQEHYHDAERQGSRMDCAPQAQLLNFCRFSRVRAYVSGLL